MEFGIHFTFKLFLQTKLNKKKIIISTLGALEPWSLEQKKLKKKIAWFFYQKKILDNCDYIHATSDDEKKHLVELGIKTPIKIIPHGVIIKSTKMIKKKNKSKKKLFFFQEFMKKRVF